MLEFRLFSRGELIKMFQEASLLGEGFRTPKDQEDAAKLEMQYAFGQGIVSKTPSPENAYMTLKTLFLYTQSADSGRTWDESFWGDIVDLSVRSDAGLRLDDVFKGDGDATRAYEWMKKIYVDTERPMAKRIFITPMFSNENKISSGDDDDVDGIGEEVPEDGDMDEVQSDDNDDGDVQLLLDKITPIVKNRDAVIGAVVEFCRPRRGRMRDDVYVPRDPTTSPTAFKADLDLVWKAARVIGNRQASTEYRKMFKKARLAEEPDVGDEQSDDSSDEEELAAMESLGKGEQYGVGSAPMDQQGGSSASTPGEKEQRDGDVEPGNHSTKSYIEDWGEDRRKKSGELPEEINHLLEFGFFVVQTFPFWYVCLIEHLALMTGRNFRSLFKRAVEKKRNNFHERWDVNRKMNTIADGDFLYDMITGPLSAMMEGFGLLDGGKEKRVVGVCGSLLSKKQKTKSWEKLARLGLQGMHTDMDVSFEWNENYAFSVITAGSEKAYLDVYPKSWDGTKGPAEEPARVALPPGHSIVFHGLSRHRGVSYPYDSLRLFVSFVVKAIVELAEAKRRVTKTNALELSTSQEPPALPLSEWKEKYNK